METRYKDTPIGRVPEDWKVTRVEELADVHGGTTPSTSRREYWDGNILWVTPSDMTKNGSNIFLADTESKINEKALNKFSLKILPIGTLLLTSRATIGVCAILKEEATINQGVTALLPRNGFHPLFYYYYFEHIKNKLKTMGSGSTFREVAKSSLKKLLVVNPSDTEQKKIAQILSTVDEAIQKADEAIASTERLEKGLMQELLTKGIGHKEFKDSEIGGIPKEWEIDRLGGVLNLCQYGLSVKMSERGKYPIIKMDDIVNGYVFPGKMKRVDLDAKTFRSFKLEKGDILFNRTNSYELVGRTGLFLLEGDYVFASYLIRLRVREDVMNSNFLARYLIFSINRLRNLATRAVHQANINATNLQKFKIPLPPIPEQQKIASILSTADNKLELLRQRKHKLERIKKGLMNELLTGRVRVRV